MKYLGIAAIAVVILAVVIGVLSFIFMSLLNVPINHWGGKPIDFWSSVAIVTLIILFRADKLKQDS